MKINPFAVMKVEIDGSGVVFSPESNQAMTLNKTGVLIWQALEQGCSDQEIVDRIMERFDGITPEQAMIDLQKFKNTLIEKELLA